MQEEAMISRVQEDARNDKKDAAVIEGDDDKATKSCIPCQLPEFFARRRSGAKKT